MEQLQKVNSEKDISSAQALAELLKELARGEKSAEKQGYISFANAENLLCSLPMESYQHLDCDHYACADCNHHCCRREKRQTAGESRGTFD